MFIRVAAACASLFLLGAVSAADLDPKAIFITPPKDIKWSNSNDGNSTAVLLGDPSKPGLYIALTKWTPGHMSHPHFHANDRYIYVVSGTWWVGTGAHWDPNQTTPIQAGSYVVHTGKEVHWDGARDTDVILEIVGMGPATSTLVPEK